jgi:hypothetical protein
MKWTHRDWAWLMILICTLIMSFYITKPSVGEILSYITSVTSIILSILAIYISIRELTKADTVKNEIHRLVGELNEKVGQIDQKINKIDLVYAQNTVDESTSVDFAKIIVKEMRRQMGIDKERRIKSGV